MKVQSAAENLQTNCTTVGKPSKCTICYESLVPSVQGMDASALTVCHHWFCNECWTQHLRSRVKQGDINISCPVSIFCVALIDTFNND